MQLGVPTLANKHELEKKPWYRFCKLCYGFAYVVSLAIAVAIGYSEFPVEYIDNDSSVIRCANGEQYSASAISSYISTTQLDSYDDEKARKLCLTRYTFDETFDLPDGRKVEIRVPESKDPKLEVPKIIEMIQQGQTTGEGFETLPPGRVPYKDLPDELKVTTVNYTYIPVKAVRGGYAPLFWDLSIVMLVGDIIRRSFLYVVAGVPFFDFSMLKKGRDWLRGLKDR